MAKYFTRSVLVILGVLLAVQICCAQSAVEPEEYLVYSCLIKGLYGDDAASQFAMAKKTCSTPIGTATWNYLNNKLSPLDADFVRDFNERISSPVEIENQFKLRSTVKLLSEPELKLIFKPERSYGETGEEDWSNFRKVYQTFSLLSLSRVGFNKSRDKALVELGSQYGYLAGEGKFYLLIKSGNKWKIKRKAVSWIS
jgi:hypothetical protein